MIPDDSTDDPRWFRRFRKSAYYAMAVNGSYRGCVITRCAEKRWRKTNKCIKSSRVHIHETSKQMELKIPSCSGIEVCWIFFKIGATGNFWLHRVHVHSIFVYTFVWFLLSTVRLKIKERIRIFNGLGNRAEDPLWHFVYLVYWW